MDFLLSLKMATRDAHQKMEQTVLLHKIITKKITQQEYHHLLHILYGFIKPCETILQIKYPDLIAGREKMPLLQSDINNITDIPCCVDIPMFETKAHTYGYLYVMEGSTLGGQIITQCLKQNSNLNPSLNPQYFNPYGKQTKKKWALFTQSLIRDMIRPNDKAIVIKSAIETFSTLATWLQISTGNNTWN